MITSIWLVAIILTSSLWKTATALLNDGGGVDDTNPLTRRRRVSTSGTGNGSTKNYTYSDLLPCQLFSVELAKLGPREENNQLEPCIVAHVEPTITINAQDSGTVVNAIPSTIATTIDNITTDIITLVQVTPSSCGNQRDGTVTGVYAINNDHNGRGIPIGFHPVEHEPTRYIKFRLISVVAGNPEEIGMEEYQQRHTSLLRSLIEEFQAPYIVGTCTFVAAMEKQIAQETQSMLLAQVGPPSFYQPPNSNPYVFGIHIDSDTYPIPNIQELDFWTHSHTTTSQQQTTTQATTLRNKETLPIRVIYRDTSDFFLSTCQSAIHELKKRGFQNVESIRYTYREDMTVQELEDLADQACPPPTPLAGEKEEDAQSSPALFVCTRTEHDVFIRRWEQNDCRPTSLWLTAATWGWALENPELVPYMQGGGQWHEALDYGDKYFDSGKELLEYNWKMFGYKGTYDQVVSYTIPLLCAEHLQAAYRVQTNPQPLADFANPEGRELLRRAMMIVNVETIFGRISFNENQRNHGRGAAATQWLPHYDSHSHNNMSDNMLVDIKSATTMSSKEEERKDAAAVIFENALVSPLLQAQASIVLPSPSAKGCDEGYFQNETKQESSQGGAILLSSCDQCPVDTYRKSTTDSASSSASCIPCQTGRESTRNRTGQTECIEDENYHYISRGLKIIAYVLFAVVTITCLVSAVWLWVYQRHVLVRISQPFLGLVVFGCWISCMSILFYGVETSYRETDEGYENPDIDKVDASCMAGVWLYGVGDAFIVGPLLAKLLRIKLLFQQQQVNDEESGPTTEQRQSQRVVVLRDVAIVGGTVLLIELIILTTWQIHSPSQWSREVLTEVDGYVTESFGGCHSEHDITYFGVLLGFQLLCLLGALVLAYQTRFVHSDFAESGSISLAVAFMFQLLLLTIPIMALASDNSNVFYIVRVGAVFLQGFTVLLLLLLPKMRRVSATFKRHDTVEGLNSSAELKNKKGSMYMSVALLTNSKWDEAVDIINRMLEEGSEQNENMTERQRRNLETVRATLLTGNTGNEKDKLLHVPRGLLRKMSMSADASYWPKKSKANAMKASNTFLLKEFAGVDLQKQSGVPESSPLLDATLSDISSRNLGADIYFPPEFEILSKENRITIYNLLCWSSLKKWNFNIFDLDKASGGNPLLFIGWAVLASPHSQYAMAMACDEDVNLEDFEGYGFIKSDLKIPQHTLCNYLREIEKDYNSENPYHNAIHAADVVQSLHALLQMAGDGIPATNLELFSILLAAVVHDVQHPGENNAFQTKARTDLSLIYNDKSTLENKHASHAFTKMFGDKADEVVKRSRRTSYINIGCKTDLNILSKVKDSQLSAIREKVVRAVLHTDMSLHFKSVNDIKAATMEKGYLSDDDTRWDILMFMLHLADISNPAKPRPLTTLWTDRCLEEFFAQGDKEEKLGLPISPNCDRRTTKKPESQIGFIKFIIQPAYDVLSGVIPQVGGTIMPIIRDNLQYWEVEQSRSFDETDSEDASD